MYVTDCKAIFQLISMLSLKDLKQFICSGWRENRQVALVFTGYRSLHMSCCTFPHSCLVSWGSEDVRRLSATWRELCRRQSFIFCHGVRVGRDFKQVLWNTLILEIWIVYTYLIYVSNLSLSAAFYVMNKNCYTSEILKFVSFVSKPCGFSLLSVQTQLT